MEEESMDGTAHVQKARNLVVSSGQVAATVAWQRRPRSSIVLGRRARWLLAFAILCHA